MTCLKYLLPISCFLLLGVSFWEVLLGSNVGAVLPLRGRAPPAFALLLWVGLQGRNDAEQSCRRSGAPPLWGIQGPTWWRKS